jgi:Uma2 family endonuclease
MATTKLMTAEDLEEMAPEEVRYELIRGELQRMAPAGGEHGEVTFEIGRLTGNHVAAHGLGRVYSADTGFLLSRNPDTVLAPDVAFVRADRLPPQAERRGFMPVVPDLVVEVVSPSDRPGYVEDKVAIYLGAGVPLIWVFDPWQRRVRVHRPGQPMRELTIDDTLDGEDVLPGFRLAIRDVFR